MKNKIVYIDMDGVLVDYNPDLAFIDMKPKEGAIEAFKNLSGIYDVYILSTAPWSNPQAWMDKVLWAKEYLGQAARKKLILSHNKNLNKGDYLIDDRPNNGADEFGGKWIIFGSNTFPDWDSVLDYLTEIY